MRKHCKSTGLGLVIGSVWLSGCQLLEEPRICQVSPLTTASESSDSGLPQPSPVQQHHQVNFQTADDLSSLEPEPLPEPVDPSGPSPLLLEGGSSQSTLPGVIGDLDQPPLSLVEVEQMALERNPALAQMSAYIQSLRGKWLQVGLPPNPNVYYSGEEMGDNGTAGQQGGYLSQQFITGGKLRLNRGVVSQEISVAEQRQAALGLKVLTDVRTGYYEVLVAQRRLDATSQLEQIGRQLQQTTAKLHEAQEASLAALLQAQVEADSIALLHFNARKNYEAAWRRLTSVIGMPELPIRPVADVSSDWPPVLHWEETLARLRTESPEVATAVMELERARAELTRAEVQYIPNIQAQAGMQYDNVDKDSIAMVQIGLPLPIINRNQGGVRQAQSEVLAAQRNLARVELNLQRRLADVFRDYENAHNQVQQYAGQILPAARRALDVIRQGFAGGEVQYLTLLTAQRTYYHTNLAYLDSLRELWVRTSQIEGMLLEESLSTSPSK